LARPIVTLLLGSETLAIVYNNPSAAKYSIHPQTRDRDRRSKIHPYPSIVIDGTLTNTNDPWLSVWKSFKQAIGCRYDVFINFKISSFDVNCHNLAFIPCFDLLPNVRFIEFLPALG
jgi:hypothetical protein